MKRLDVPEMEFRRLLGYRSPAGPRDDVRRLSARARQWYGEHGRPWTHQRIIDIDSIDGDRVRLAEGTVLESPTLARRLEKAEAKRVALVAASAGGEVSAEVARLWENERPDESFVLDSFASAVVETLVRQAGIELCDWAEPEKLSVLPHHSPGYDGWPLSDQKTLFGLLQNGKALPGELDILPSGMLNPQKSQLAVFGVTPRGDLVENLAELCPCRGCSLADCQYRRAPFAGAASPQRTRPESAPKVEAADYAFPKKALERWSRELLLFHRNDDGNISASFSYDGTTCSNMGLPLKLVYTVNLSGNAQGYEVADAHCRIDGEGSNYDSMCAAVEDLDGFLSTVEADRPLLGRRLDDALTWNPEVTPSGCVCGQGDRDHKWRVVYQTLHYAIKNGYHEENKDE